MASSTSEKRVVMILGKTGGGKSTVANHVLGNPKYSFKVKDTKEEYIAINNYVLPSF